MARIVTFALQVLFVIAFFAIIAAIIRFLWAAGSSPKTVADFIRADFMQALAALFTAAATVALWLVTASLVRVTKVQVHAATAPLIFAGLVLRHDPPGDGEAQIHLPFYEWTAEDQSTAEMNAFHLDHAKKISEYEVAFRDWRIASTRVRRATYRAQIPRPQEPGSPPPAPLPPPPAPPEPIRPPSRYIVLILLNSQAQSGYGLATDVQVETTLRFPRYSTIRGASGTTVPAADTSYELPRTFSVNAIFGQGTYNIAAYRVDEIPYWTLSIARIRYKDFRGRSRTFAVGARFGAYSVNNGLQVQQGSWPATKGELPS